MDKFLLSVDEMVNTKLKSMIDSGSIAKMVETKIEKTVQDVIDNELRSYSDFGKGLQEYIKKSLQVNFDSLGFEGYNENLLRVISKVYQDSMQSEHLKKIENLTKKMLANPPELVTLSSLVEAVKEKAMEVAEKENASEYEETEYEGTITCIIKDRHDKFFTYIYLDEKENVSAHNCNYQIGICKTREKPEIFSLRLKNEDSSKLFVTETYGLERLLFKAKCASSAFEFDVENPDLDYSVTIEQECHC